MLHNIKMFYEEREHIINSFNDYSKTISEANSKATKVAGLKILTTKQILQKLRIALVHVKTVNTADNFLSEI